MLNMMCGLAGVVCSSFHCRDAGARFNHQEEVEPVTKEYRHRNKDHRTDFALGIVAQKHKEGQHKIDDQVEEEQRLVVVQTLAEKIVSSPTLAYQINIY